MFLNVAFLVFGVLAFLGSIVIICDSIKNRQGLRDAIIAVFMMVVGFIIVNAALSSIF